MRGEKFFVGNSRQHEQVQVEVTVKCSSRGHKWTRPSIVTSISHDDFNNDNNALLNVLALQLPTENWSRLEYDVIGENKKVIEHRVIMDCSTMEFEYFEGLQCVLYEMVGEKISTNTWKFTLYSKP
jgi:hypothetical protein